MTPVTPGTESGDKAFARRAKGLCPDCGQPRGKRSRCPTHLVVHRDRERARRARVTLKREEEKAA